MERARQNAEARALLAVGPSLPTTDPELARVRMALEAAASRLARLDVKASKSTDDNGEGIFS